MSRAFPKRFLEQKFLRSDLPGAQVGSKFQTLDVVKKYVFRNTSSANEYLIRSEETQELPVPTKETIFKLLRLSGLRIKNADIEGTQKNLSKQISFISIIQKSDLDDTLDAKYARLLPRQNVPLDYKDLMKRANHNVKNAELAESSGTWHSISTASRSKNGYFIVTEESLDNREQIEGK